MSTPGGTSITSVGVAAYLGEHGADVLGADERRACRREGLGSPGRERGVSAHRVLELGAVRLDGERRARRSADRPAEEDVVREDDVGRQERPERGRVRLDPGVELGPGAVLDAPDVVAVVAVEDEDGQEAADVRPHGRRAAEVVALRVRLLREDGDVVPALLHSRASMRV